MNEWNRSPAYSRGIPNPILFRGYVCFIESQFVGVVTGPNTLAFAWCED